MKQIIGNDNSWMRMKQKMRNGVERFGGGKLDSLKLKLNSLTGRFPFLAHKSEAKVKQGPELHKEALHPPNKSESSIEKGKAIYLDLAKKKQRKANVI